MHLIGTRSYFLVVCLFASLSLVAKEAKTTGAQGLGKPLCFVENKGQVTGQDNQQINDIQYKLTTPGLSLYIGNGKLHYQFKEVKGTDAATLQVKGYGMDVTLLGANPNAKVIPAEKQEYYENYFLAQLPGDGITAHSYDRITYKNVYPNIDWVLYVKNGKVEYDFVVRPGGNAHDIQLQYNGATALNINKDGNISAETPMGNVQEHKPYAYEKGTGKAVAADFVLHNNIVSFETGDYRGTLTIDPYLLFSTYFGGTAEDVVTSVKETTTGVTFAGGFTASIGIGTVGTYRSSTYGGPPGTYDAFLAKYDATGALKFVSYFGGAGNDQGTCIALDNTGAGSPSIYLVGYTTSNFITSTGTLYKGLNDGFIMKFSNVGGIQWSTYYGGTKDDFIYGVTCDAANNVYITGQTASTSGITTAGAYQTVLEGLNDAFVAKFNGTTGAQIWGTYYGGTAQDVGYAIALDNADNAFITGQTNSIIKIATAGAYQTSLDGTNDAFVAEINPTGTSLVWGTYFGGSGTDQGNGIVCNQTTGDVAVTGSTTSPGGIATANAFQATYAGGPQDAFVAYLNNSGGLQWSTYYGGVSPDYGQGICLDPTGNVIIAGGTFSNTGIASAVGTFAAAEYQSAIGGDYDAFVSKFNMMGQRLWGSYFGGLLYDYANAVAYDASTGGITIGGFTTDNLTYGIAGGIATAGAAQGTNMGGVYDGFITKFHPDTLVEISQPYVDNLVCAGGTLKVNYFVNNSFLAGNTFTIQLSNAVGSFAAPVNIGTVTATGSGTVTCVIPVGTTPGTGYRIRITGNKPIYISADDYYNIEVASFIVGTTASGTTPVCVGGTISLSDIAPYTINSYSWVGPPTSGLGGGGFTSALQSPSNNGFTGFGITKADSGEYYVTTVHNGCPAHTDSVNIVVNDDVPPMPADSTALLTCAGNSLYLFANPDTTAPLTYNWIGPAGFTSTAQNPVILATTAANSGTYFLYDVLAGCASLTNSIVVNITPVTPDSISIAVSPGDTVCGGTLVSFSVKTGNAGASPAYQWMSAAFTPITGAISNTYASATLIDGETIFCVMTSSVLCPFPATATSNSIKMNIITNPPAVYITSNPSVVVSMDSAVTFNSVVYNGGVGAQYQWKMNGTDISGANSSTMVLTSLSEKDTITLEVTSTMKCSVPDSAMSNAIIIGTNVGVANVAPFLENITLYPNPNNGSFTVKGDYNGMNTNNLSFEILNPIGQVLYTDKTTVQYNSINKAIALDNIPDGIYLLHVYNEEQSKTIRFTIQR